MFITFCSTRPRGLPSRSLTAGNTAERLGICAPRSNCRAVSFRFVLVQKFNQRPVSGPISKWTDRLVATTCSRAIRLVRRTWVSFFSSNRRGVEISLPQVTGPSVLERGGTTSSWQSQIIILFVGFGPFLRAFFPIR